MSAEQFAPIKPQALAGLDRVIAGMPFLAPKQPLPDARLSSIQTVASNDAEKQAAVADVAISDAPPPQVQIDPSPLTDDEIAYGQRIANEMAEYEAEMNQRVADATAAVHAQAEAEISVMSGVGEGVSDGGGVGSSAKRKSSNRGAKRNPKAVQQVIDYLMRNPDDIALTVAQLTDKLRYDVRMKVGHSSVGKAIGIMKADGKEKAS